MRTAMSPVTPLSSGTSQAQATPLKVAIIGAGPSGVVCAKWMLDIAQTEGRSVEVHLFDKGRRVGGRASSLPDERATREERLDYGALVLERPHRALLPRTAALLEEWSGRGELRVIEVTQTAQVGDRAWVATRGVGGLLEALLASHPEIITHTSHHVRALTSGQTAWRVSGTLSPADADFEYEGFDLVVCAAPAPQSAALVSEIDPLWARELAALELTPQWSALMWSDLTWPDLAWSDLTSASTTQSTPKSLTPWVVWDPSLAESPLIARVSAERSKRDPTYGDKPEWLCVQTRAAWSRAQLDTPRDEIGALLRAELLRLHTSSRSDHSASSERVSERSSERSSELQVGRVQRWRLARVESPIRGWGGHLDLERGLGGCGDSYREGGVIGAFESAELLVERWNREL